MPDIARCLASMDDVREAEPLAIIKAQAERIEALARENQLLRRKIDILVRRIFGPSSEPNGVR